MSLKRPCLILLLNLIGCSIVIAQKSFHQSVNEDSYILHQPLLNSFKIIAARKPAPIYIDTADWKGVTRAAQDLANDIGKVSGVSAPVRQDVIYPKGAIVVGTIGKSRLIDRLIAEHRIDVSSIKGKWESYIIKATGNQLIIAGSDKRGTIYGIYDVSQKIGVSPWYWWADAPVQKSAALYVRSGTYIQGPPKVKYRGIFINDEDPSLLGWAKHKFGGVNSKMYAHMFELLLRLKANYLWPAMWGKAFNEDDPLDPVLADEYGIVMGTSHHEPMMRAQKEYTVRSKQIGPWDYTTNATNLKAFWTEGLQRNKNFDNLITIGMRGDGDVAMGKGDDQENIKVLRKVIADQRNIIANVYHKDAAEVPQLWAIFTEVQRYYDAGLNVPDDVTLLFCDNNWGYIRRTGPIKEKNRKGGLGLYYHIDMNGGPWNDRWINTTTISKLHNQLSLAYHTGLDRIWIVNVGDLKPKELPIDFIMKYAWDPDAIPANRTDAYTVAWAGSIFGKAHEEEIADLISKYTKYNLWRKPEVEDPGIYSLVNYNEADRVLTLWRQLAKRAEALATKIPPEAQDAYYELVLYPIKASAGVAEIYIDAAYNNLYARQGRVSANKYAEEARQLFELDKRLSNRYNDSIAAGKWKNMMQDVHIGYQRWSMPRENSLPPLSEITPLPEPSPGVTVEGSELAWPQSNHLLELPAFDMLDRQQRYIDIFNRGRGSFSFKVTADKPWIKLTCRTTSVEDETRVLVDIDWNSVPKGETTAVVDVHLQNNVVPVNIKVINKPVPLTSRPFYGGWSGEFSIPSPKYSANVAGTTAKWIVLPDLGRSAACMGIYPVNSPSASPATAPRLEYNVFLADSGTNKVCLGILPTQDVNPQRGLRIAVSIDNQPPQILDARKGFHDEFHEYTPENLARSRVLKPLPDPGKDYALRSRNKPRRNEVFDDLRWLDAAFKVDKAGMHTLRIYMIDPEVVLEQITFNPDDNHPSYFGAPPIWHAATRRVK